MLTRIKDQFHFLFKKAASIAHNAGLTPNTITFMGFFSAIVSATLYLQGYPVSAALFILISGFFDTIDGVMATMYREKTKFGAFLDSTLDRLSDALIFSSIIIAKYCDAAWGLTALVASFLVSYARARAEGLGIKMGGVGLIERPERMLILSSASFLYFIWAEALSYGVILIAMLSALTLSQRVAFTYRKTSSK